MAKFIAGGVAFVDNFVLWGEAGYFDKAIELKPLMNLWSLGIEEQFYLVFPVFVVAIWRYRLAMVVSSFSIAAVSLWATIHFSAYEQSATFYLPLFRAWELLLGVLLTLGYAYFGKWFCPHSPERAAIFKSIYSSNTVLILGVAFIVISVALISSNDLYPRWLTLLPVIGALFVIGAGPDALANRWLFSSRLLVFVGLISYPLYLWHWQVLSLARILVIGGLSHLLTGFLLFVSFVLAYASYRFVEFPIRFVKKSPYKLPLLVFAAICVAGIGLNIYKREGLPFRHAWMFRYPAVLREAIVVRFDDDRYFRSGKCHLRVNQGPEGFAQACEAKDGERRPAMFL